MFIFQLNTAYQIFLYNIKTKKQGRKVLKKRTRKKNKIFFLSISYEMDPNVEHTLTQAKQEQILGEK